MPDQIVTGRRRGLAAAVLAAIAATASPAGAAEASGPPRCVADIKLILMIRRKPGMSAAAFRDYYENHHVPLAIRLGGHFLSDYRRNFIRDNAGHDKSGFDVVTEIWFKSKAELAAMYAFNARPEVAAQIAADEEKFMDRPANRAFAVDECRTGF